MFTIFIIIAAAVFSLGVGVHLGLHLGMGYILDRVSLLELDREV